MLTFITVLSLAWSSTSTLLIKPVSFRIERQECECSSFSQELVCKICIPQEVPENVQGVTVYNNLIPISNRTFSHVSWRMVRTVNITEEDQATDTFQKQTFRNLKSLEYLGLHLNAAFRYLPQIGNGNFAGLKNLKHLDISNCNRFSFDLLYVLLQKRTNFPNVNTLSVNQFNSVGYGSILDFNATFLTILGKRGITHLNAEGSRIKSVYASPDNVFCSSVESIDMRKTILGELNATKKIATCKSLRYIDVSKAVLPPTARRISLESGQPVITVNITNSKNVLAIIYFFLNVETLLADSVLRYSIMPAVKYIIIFERDIELATQHISLRGNDMSYLNLELHSRCFRNIKSLNLGKNNLEFVSPNFFANLSSIKNLSLADNVLSKMAVRAERDFGRIMNYLTELEHIDLSNNGLQFIPDRFFIRNKKLKVILLSKNKLQEFKQNQDLKPIYVDLKDNYIATMDADDMTWYNGLEMSNKNTFKLNLRGNNFQCSCSNLDFVEWLKDSQFVIKDSPLSCILNGKTMHITNDSVKALQKECNRVNHAWLYTIIGVGSLFTLLFVAFSFKAIYCHYRNKIYRRRRKKQTLWEIQTGGFKYDFVVFIVFSSKDDRLVMDQICPEVVSTLCRITGETRNLVCIGDHDFRPGYSIYNEMQRCLDKSAVILAIVSQNFCHSVHCCNELEQAFLMQKPVIIAMVEVVREDEMPPLVERLFQQNVRAKIDVSNGYLVSTPSMDRLCTAMLELVPK